MRCLIPGFTLERKGMPRPFGMLGEWLKLELTEGFYTWFSNEEEEPTPAAAEG
jgi:hypothetical protein